MNNSKSLIFFLMGALVVCFFFVTDVQAGISLNLTTAGASGSINDAWFVQIDPQSTGTGVIDPFVRIQATGTEQGYNGDWRPVQFDEDHTNVNWNHALALSTVPIVNIDFGGGAGAIDYRQFLLDINESSGGTGSLLSLYELEIYVHNDPDLHNYPTDFPSPIYDLDGAPDGDSVIELDYSLNAGSGSGDMFAYIPNSLFSGGSYVTLYSAFGNPNASSDGFEEWSVLEGEVIPVPPSVIIGLIGMCAAGIKLRKFA